MTVIIEGVDALGKDTQISFIENYLESTLKSVHKIHYSSLNFTDNMDVIKKMSEIQYEDMFKLISLVKDDINIVLNRSHIGEAVYSPMYRNYSGDYVFDLEKKYIDDLNNVKLILFTDTAENICRRDIARGDGQSFTTDVNKKQMELDLFDRAFNKSILNKKRIELLGRSAEEIFNTEVKPFLFGDV